MAIFAKQMKKYLVFLFVLFYFSVASGATVQFHYCMGKLVEWGFAHPEPDDTCSKCKMENSDRDGCCKQEQQQLKVEKAQKAEFNFQFKAAPDLVALPSYCAPGQLLVQQLTTGANFSHAPPRTSKTPVFVQLRTFRI